MSTNLKMRTMTLIALWLCLTMVSCGPSTVRKYAAVLAADTGKLNDQFEALTKSRQEINNIRDDLANSFELAILQAENYNARRLDVWRALKESDKTHQLRYSFFTSIQMASEAAFIRDDTMASLSEKLNVVRKEGQGKKSQQLGEATKALADLSKDISLADSVKFLVGYGQSIQDEVKKAEEKASNASEAAKKDATDTGEAVKKDASDTVKRPLK